MPARPEPKDELQLRRVRFSTLVDRALDSAFARGMTVEDIEDATGVGSSTFYGWKGGQWKRDPVPARVYAFCDGLHIPREEADRALGWSTAAGRPAAPTPLIEDPDVRALMRRLTDPKTPENVKRIIRRQIRALAAED